MNGLRPDAHVAQQSRRDKLRVQSDLFQVRAAASCDPVMFSSPASAAAGVADFVAGCQVPLIAPSSSSMSFGGESAAAIHPQPGCDWSPPSSLVPYSHLYHHPTKPGLAGYHVDGSTDLHFLPQVAIGNQGRELQSLMGQAPCSWTADGGGNEMLLLPNYAGDPPAAMLMARQIPQEWSAEGNFTSQKFDQAVTAAASGGNDRRAVRGLSLTLASNTLPELGMATTAQLGTGPSGAYAKFMMTDRSFDGGGSLQDIVSSPSDAAGRRAGAGPLGPFTGYATILRNSRFLRPAQQLLDEFCSVVTGSKLAKRSYAAEASRGAAASSSHDAVPGEKESSSRCGNSGGASTSSLYSSAEAGGDQGGVAGYSGSSGAPKIHRPEFQQKKAKLLHMQEEVCRRYKQYHQQMQMVVSSFESVAGLNSATPYSSLALKAISKHFRSLKNAISDQIRHISKVLGEELMSSPSVGRGESTTTATPRLKYLDQTLRKQKAGEGTLSFMENNQPVWRPQRGLPERAVSVLRAWLFEHFLHPYPTDTDKHMLATQTGLSRNQVSNWFINARVRLWKPMIEEIHMLETKGMSGMDLNSASARDARPASAAAAVDGGAHSGNDQRFQPQCNEPLDCASVEAAFTGESSRNLEAWQGDKRSRVEECEMLTGMDAGLMSFATYQHAMDIGGIEAVSLTLGLRHEGGQQNPQQMRHLGTQMFHDLVG